MHNEWNFSAGIHMNVHTYMYTLYIITLHINLYPVYIDIHNPVNNKVPQKWRICLRLEKKRFPFPCRYLRPGHGLCETDGLYHGVGKSQLGLKTYGRSIEDYENQKRCVCKVPSYLLFSARKKHIKGSFNTPLEDIPKPLPKRPHSGNLFWLGGLPRVIAKIQVEASCLDEVFSSLNAEKREALVKVTFGSGSCGMVPEKMYQWQKDGMKQKDQFFSKCYKWTWRSCSWIGFGGCGLGISLQSQAILLQFVSAFDACRLGYIPFVGRRSLGFSCAVFCNSEGLAEEGDLLPFADTGSFFESNF